MARPILKYGGALLVGVVCIVVALAARRTANQPVQEAPHKWSVEDEARMKYAFAHPPTAQPIPKPMLAAAEKMLAEYNDNELAADNKYKGKRVRHRRPAEDEE